ncbi:MAG: PIN domain-containing protein [Methanobrevibacter sp.]|jgi:predicted nucleic acid-binding protein|nr:PIN domain-containing protein [Candidatus Methanovirga aequatorialis]
MIFLDTDFLMSFFIDTEVNHKKTVRIYEKIKNERLIISNSIILEVMTVSNIKIKVSKELLEKIYTKLNDGTFRIIEDIPLYDMTMKRQISYLPERISFFDCLYMELMQQLEINKIATFDKHFKNKGIEIIQ